MTGLELKNWLSQYSDKELNTLIVEYFYNGFEQFIENVELDEKHNFITLYS